MFVEFTSCCVSASISLGKFHAQRLISCAHTKQLCNNQHQGRLRNRTMFALIRYWVERPSFYFPLKLLHSSFLTFALCFRFQLLSSAFLEHHKSSCYLLSIYNVTGTMLSPQHALSHLVPTKAPRSLVRILQRRTLRLQLAQGHQPVRGQA